MAFYQGITAVAEPDTSGDGQLEAAKAALKEATDAVGVAELDGTDLKQPEKMLAEAQAKVRAREAAIEVQQQRDAKAAADEVLRQEALARWRHLGWYAAYVERIKPVIELRARLIAAEEHAMALESAESELGALPIPSNAWLSEQIESGRLPELTRLPRHARGGEFTRPAGGARAAAPPDLTPQVCAEEAKRLKPLVEQAAKEAGKPRDASEAPRWEAT